jgi:hypothetical protein
VTPTTIATLCQTEDLVSRSAPLADYNLISVPPATTSLHATLFEDENVDEA